ncbi:hypothetical protein OKW45_003416 [Paraburkholderia sp. WSM4175]|uniref:hypothetical protein n=1 Tax=Paraburkholderia sp. WSM4175 TaxID=2991072 RepID=UPI003D260E58
MRNYHYYRYEREMCEAQQQLGAFLAQTCRDEMPQLQNPEYEAYYLGPEDAPAPPKAA